VHDNAIWGKITANNLSSFAFWDIMLRSLLKVGRRFKGTHRLYFRVEGQVKEEPRTK
jgi:hypothetical protein